MTISTTTIKNSYSGNGSTSVFNYTFKITDEDHIQVIIRSAAGTETTKTKTTHYTVSGVGNVVVDKLLLRQEIFLQILKLLF